MGVDDAWLFIFELAFPLRTLPGQDKCQRQVINLPESQRSHIQSHISEVCHRMHVCCMAEPIGLTLVYVLTSTRSAALRICSVPAPAVQSPTEQIRNSAELIMIMWLSRELLGLVTPVVNRTAPWLTQNASGGGCRMAEQNRIWTITQWIHIWWNLCVTIRLQSSFFPEIHELILNMNSLFFWLKFHYTILFCLTN